MDVGSLLIPWEIILQLIWGQFSSIPNLKMTLSIGGSFLCSYFSLNISLRSLRLREMFPWCIFLFSPMTLVLFSYKFYHYWTFPSSSCGTFLNASLGAKSSVVERKSVIPKWTGCFHWLRLVYAFFWIYGCVMLLSRLPF